VVVVLTGWTLFWILLGVVGINLITWVVMARLWTRVDVMWKEYNT
jgi:hypothetical protein